MTNCVFHSNYYYFFITFFYSLNLFPLMDGEIIRITPASSQQGEALPGSTTQGLILESKDLTTHSAEDHKYNIKAAVICNDFLVLWSL